MNRDGVPLPSTLSGNITERLVRIDKALFYLVLGALVELTDDWWLEQTGSLTVEDAKAALMDMLWCFQEACDVTPIGVMQIWPSASIPDRWLLCNGQSLLRASYAALFSILGTTYGAADGTHFNVPDLRDRSPMMPGGGIVNALAQQVGAETIALSIANLPVHDHNYADPGHVHTLTDPGHFHTFTDPGHVHPQNVGAADAYLATGGTGRTGYGAVTTASTTAVLTDSSVTGMNFNGATTGATIASHSTGITHNAQGSGSSHSNVHPVLGVHFIIYAGV